MVLVIRVDDLSFSIYPHLPLFESFLVLHIYELRWHIVERELLTARCASVRADELAEERGSDENFIDLGRQYDFAFSPRRQR